MKTLILSILIILYSTLSFSQTGNEISLVSRISSLKQELNQETEQTRQIDIMLEIAEIYQNHNIDSSLYYANICLKSSEEIGYIHGQVGAFSFFADGFIDLGNLPKAMELSLKALEMAKDIPVRIGGIGKTYDNIGRIYFIIGDYPKAREFFNREVSLSENDKVGVTFGNYNIASVYAQVEELDSALLFLEKSYEAFSHINYMLYPYIYHVYPGWYNLRAQIYLKKNRPDLALNDLQSSLRMTLKNEDYVLTANTYNDLAAFYKTTDYQDSSIFYAEQSMIFAKKTAYSQGILNASSILAEQFEDVDPAKALYYYKIASETRNSFYGAGNIQAIRDMITQNENKQREIETAKLESRNKIRLNTLSGSLLTLLVVAILLFRNNRVKQKAKQKIEKAYDLLKSTQSQLIQSEKMASLGELTAGIAHEIQNPLNFVNNFSEISNELIDEMKEEQAADNWQLATEIADDIKQNLEKINHHGKRAADIVKGMLQHSRTSSGVKEPTDINALADEYLRLAYHGLRAKDKSFNAEFKTEFDETLPKINVIPQDIGRVLLNLINNAFYAVSERAKLLTPPPPEGGIKNSKTDYKPTVTVSTASWNPPSGGRGVRIVVKDNGDGIPPHIVDKIFQPFFTTKPTGQGTGLGLSLAYDIVKAHGGGLNVETKDGEGSIFTIQIPIN
jgi:two-component system, NtrC family, sensor kinase